MAEIIVLFAAFDWIFRGGFVLIFQSAARVAELVDAHGSGPCDLTIMGVRVPPRAQNGKARATWSGPFAVPDDAGPVDTEPRIGLLHGGGDPLAGVVSTARRPHLPGVPPTHHQ